MTIKILGGGVAGLTAAINLAKAGIDVKVFERGKRPKPILETAVHALRNYGFDKRIVEQLKKTGIKLPKLVPIYKVYKFSPSLKCTEITSKEPIFWTFLRGSDENSLDSVMLKQAEKVGVEIEFEKQIDEKEAKIIAFGPKRVDIMAYGYHFESLNIESRVIYLFYDNRIAPKGYFYVLPYDDIGGDVVTVSICSPKHYSLLPKLFERAVSENKVIAEILDGAERKCAVRGYSCFDIPRSAVKNGRLYVGEAAGFQDASKGFGVKFAILSGWCAARSIIEGKDYDRLWKQEFLDELVYYFKKRIILQRTTNKHFEKMIVRLGETATKDAELEQNRPSRILDFTYLIFLFSWKVFRRV